MKAGAIILAGGKSSRMGQNKALLPINGRSNIERITSSLQEVFDDILIVANDKDLYQFLNIPITTDKVKEKGPMAGIQAGLLAAKHEKNLVVACDMPFVSSKLAKIMLKQSEGYQACVPVIFGKQHPMFAVYKKSILNEIELCLKLNRLRMKQLLEQVNVKYLTEEDFENKQIDLLDQVFYNMNHPSEYEEAIKIAKK